MTVDVFAQLGKEILESALFQEALKHRSAGSNNNERLEYLGDAVLGLVIAEYLFASHPQTDEGGLSRLRAHLVRKSTLAEIAQNNDLGELIKLGPGELKSGGHRRDTILADALEAVFGALYLLKGLQYVKDFIFLLYREKFAGLPGAEELKDPKSRLQEVLQSRNLPLPEYELSTVEGEPHAQAFKVTCSLPRYGIEVIGKGTSKRKAEQDSAEKALKMLLQADAS